MEYNTILEKINDIINRNISVQSKKGAIQFLINQIPDENMRNVFWTSYNNYKWPVKGKHFEKFIYDLFSFKIMNAASSMGVKVSKNNKYYDIVLAENNINDNYWYNFNFLCVLVKENAVSEIRYEKNGSNRKISFKLNNDFDINEIENYGKLRQSEDKSWAIAWGQISDSLGRTRELLTETYLFLRALRKNTNGVVSVNLINNHTNFQVAEKYNKECSSCSDAIRYVLELQKDKSIVNPFETFYSYTCSSKNLPIEDEKDALEAAKTFSGGRASLEEFLYFCFTNDIETYSIRDGYGDKLGHISFDIKDQTTKECIDYALKTIGSWSPRDPIYNSVMDGDYPVFEKKLCSRVPFYVTIEGYIDFIAARYVNSRVTLEYKDEDADRCLRPLLYYCRSFIKSEKAKKFGDSTVTTKVLKK